MPATLRHTLLSFRDLLVTAGPFLLLAAPTGAQPQDKLPPAPEGFDARRAGAEKGTLETVEYDSKTVGIKRKMVVYLPPRNVSGFLPRRARFVSRSPRSRGRDPR